MKIGLSVISIIVIFVSLFIEQDIFERALNAYTIYNQTSPEFRFEVLIDIVNLPYKVIGLVIVLLAIIGWIKNRRPINRTTKILWIYSVITILLYLPIYHSHGGLDGKVHGHSFWEGSLHFH